MEVFSKVVKPGDEFFYQRGEVTTTTPWLRPTYNRVKSFLKEVEEFSEIFNTYESYIMGGVLFDFNTTWDLDIGLVGGDKSNEVLERALNYMTDLSLNKYRILTDIYWYPLKKENISYPELVEDNFLQKSNLHRTIGYVKKQIGEEIQEIDLRKKEDVTVLTNFLVEKDPGTVRHTEKMINKIRDNKKYTTVVSFNIDEFLQTDEAYFMRHTNRTND